MTNISDPNIENVDTTLGNDQSGIEAGDVGEEGVCTSTPLAAIVLRGSAVSNAIKPMVCLEISDDSDASLKNLCKLFREFPIFT